MVLFEMEMMDDLYDWRRGYDNTNPEWFEHIVYFDPSTGDRRHDEVVKWLYDKIDHCERHARWARFYDCTRVKFRYERDYLWFKLSF